MAVDKEIWMWGISIIGIAAAVWYIQKSTWLDSIVTGVIATIIVFVISKIFGLIK